MSASVGAEAFLPLDWSELQWGTALEAMVLVDVCRPDHFGTDATQVMGPAVCLDAVLRHPQLPADGGVAETFFPHSLDFFFLEFCHEG